jgi:hypothetical protein
VAVYQFPHYPEQVPDSLKSGRCWVGCDADKVPYIAGTDRRAKSTDPDTWRTYDEALEAYSEGLHVGIGRVFSADDPFVGIDLDGVRNADGIEPEALRILRFLDSYSEVSPSGNGIKVWVRADLERSYVKPGLEVYRSGRYFTVTGQILSQGSARVEERRSEIGMLIGREFPTPPRPRRTEDYNGPELDLNDYLNFVEVFKEVHDGQGTKYAVRCPWSHEHSNGVTGTYVGQRTNGAAWFHCNHAHCAHRSWKDFKKKVLPGFRMKITRPGYTGDMEIKHG